MHFNAVNHNAPRQIRRSPVSLLIGVIAPPTYGLTQSQHRGYDIRHFKKVHFTPACDNVTG